MSEKSRTVFYTLHSRLNNSISSGSTRVKNRTNVHIVTEDSSNCPMFNNTHVYIQVTRFINPSTTSLGRQILKGFISGNTCKNQLG